MAESQMERLERDFPPEKRAELYDESTDYDKTVLKRLQRNVDSAVPDSEDREIKTEYLYDYLEALSDPITGEKAEAEETTEVVDQIPLRYEKLFEFLGIKGTGERGRIQPLDIDVAAAEGRISTDMYEIFLKYAPTAVKHRRDVHRPYVQDIPLEESPAIKGTRERSGPFSARLSRALHHAVRPVISTLADPDSLEDLTSLAPSKSRKEQLEQLRKESEGIKVLTDDEYQEYRDALELREQMMPGPFQERKKYDYILPSGRGLTFSQALARGYITEEELPPSSSNIRFLKTSRRPSMYSTMSTEFPVEKVTGTELPIHKLIEMELRRQERDVDPAYLNEATMRDIERDRRKKGE
jgi:hypothetical protein